MALKGGKPQGLSFLRYLTEVLTVALPPVLLFVAGWLWLSLISIYVPEPYLDEIFHIPQAQRYCDGKWNEWDNKITTPPGLYAVSVLASKASILGFGNICSAEALRSANVWSINLLAMVAAYCRSQIELNLAKENKLQRGAKTVSLYALYTGFNIALFPVLFFFSALYYTDVMSTLAVLIAYSNHLTRIRQRKSSILNDLWTVVLGIFSLTMRQTNVFWVVIYLGGMEAVHAVKVQVPEKPKELAPGTPVKQTFSRYTRGAIHDLPISQACPGDVFFTVVSIGIAVCSNPFKVLRQVWPHVVIIASFGAFVAWNGGVVLGDKSNHVATLHLAQMLYIWPLFAFFSAPLFVSEGLSVLGRAFGWSGSRLDKSQPSGATVTQPSESYSTSTEVKPNSTLKKRVKRERNAAAESSLVSDSTQRPNRQSNSLLLRRLSCAALLLLFCVGAVAVVKYNTIIHPFTLADNRHYMFYIFRYTIRRPGLFRYYLVLPYLFSAFLVYGSLAHGNGASSRPSSLFNHHPYDQEPEGVAQSNTAFEREPVPGARAHDVVTLEDDEVSKLTVPSSTTILLLLSTTLSLITAPLVEPRYFIIPWVMWRLLVPAWSTKDFANAVKHIPVISPLLKMGRSLDLRLFLETLWFACINLATMAIFLGKPYQWRAEDGTVLDEGRLQRFMW